MQIIKRQLISVASIRPFKGERGMPQEVRLRFIFTEDSFRVDHPELDAGADDELRESFIKDRYAALFQAGFGIRGEGEDPSLRFLRSISEAFLRDLTSQPDLEIAREWTRVELSDETFEKLERTIPFCLGVEHINRSWLALQYMQLTNVFASQLRSYKGTVKMFLEERSQNLRMPERVFFHLVENKDNTDMPFAFLATYSTRDEEEKVRHMPLSFALEEYKHERTKLLELLSCLSKVAEKSDLLAGFIESGELFHPLYFSASEAYSFLKSVPDIESCGVVCRIPKWWRQHNSTVSFSITLGDDKPPMCGFDSIISMKPSLVVDGMELTENEIRKLLKSTEGLAQLKGRWVEVDHNRLRTLIDVMDHYSQETSLLMALRGEVPVQENIDIDIGPIISNGKWLSGLLKNLRQPGTIKSEKVPSTVKAELRSYQEIGFRWLCYMEKLGFGACLADDMGLGKTLQVLAFLSWYHKSHKSGRILLVVPASLIGNWNKEAEKFTPKLPVRVLHGSPAKTLEESYFSNPSFLNITTYGMALRMERLQEETFDYVILDEAQAIKNPAAKQTRAIKKLHAQHKILMTGTPIENDLTNLWSLFDFLNKGLLGSSEEFRSFASDLSENTDGYDKLRSMISPFILRRMKSDKKIIADLPDKVEKNEYVTLSKKQIVLYRKLVEGLEMSIGDTTGMQRRGLVLAYITKLKQICNHPDQYLGQERYDIKESGKFETLKTICETIYERREKVLVFTQYKEIIPYLSDFLSKIFMEKGLVIHGGVPVAKRQKLVDQFNGEDYIPFMVLSLKAGGTGLNLTSANHVIHFDRWWNPAVENQATDRAYRIGQDRSVIVHKFITTGTIEEKIDKIIQQKTELADSVIGSSGENWITEMSNEEIVNMLRLEV